MTARRTEQGTGGRTRLNRSESHFLFFCRKEVSRDLVVARWHRVTHITRVVQPPVVKCAVIFDIDSLAAGTDKAGQFYQQLFAYLFSYVSNRIPEIADDLYKVDDAMKAGFGWELGTFETWDLLGVDAFVKVVESKGLKVADWVKEMLAKGITNFYKVENGKKYYYDRATKN